MGSEWTEGTLADIAEVLMGQSPPGKDCSKEPIGPSLLNGPTEFGSHSPETRQYTENPKRMSKDGDLLFCVRGSIGRMNWSDQEYAIGRGLAAIRHKDPDCQQYLRGVIDYRLDELLSVATGSTFPNVSRNQILGIKVNIPPLPEQKEIAHILGSLDDRIELNNRMNATLEGMAQALFKSWFVDFDPVIDNALAAGNPIPPALQAKAELRMLNAESENSSTHHSSLSTHHSLFPAAFEFTEQLGWIPEGWDVAKAENLVTRHKVKQKFTKKNALNEGPVPIFDQGAGLLLGYSELPADQDSSKENPRFIFGDHTCITHLSTKPFSVGPNVIPLSAKTHAPYWTYYAIKDIQEFQEYRRHWMEFSIKETLLPSPELVAVFNDHAKEFRASMELNDEMSKTLARLRDVLLPKLISGELRIPKAEQLTEEALA